MIRLIQGAEIEAMHRLRAAVFHERLARPVTVLDGWERDGFDELNPLYVLVTTRDGTVRGSARLLPTTGPNMLADVFCDLLPEGKGALADHLGELTVLGAARPPRAAGLPDQPNRRRAARRHRRGRHARRLGVRRHRHGRGGRARVAPGRMPLRPHRITAAHRQGPGCCRPVRDDGRAFEQCQRTSAPYSPSAPRIRLQFAKRLKQLRTEKGFARARTFAKALGIEENRYTRYERAEVEPSFTLFHRMCQALQVSPNDLLCFTADTLELSPRRPSSS